LERSPAPGVIGVDPAAPLSVRFSERVRPESLAFSLVGPGGAVPVATSYDPAARTATFDPAAVLALGAEYTASLDRAQDLAGNPLAAPVTWTFASGAAPRSSGFRDLIVPGADRTAVLSATFNSIGLEVFYTGDDDGDASAALRFKRAAD